MLAEEIIHVLMLKESAVAMLVYANNCHLGHV